MNEQALYQLDQVRRIVQTDKVILDIDSLSLPKGELTAIVGPNGAGKSTLLKMLAFLDAPDQGCINFQGQPTGPQDFTGLRRQITMVDQAPLMFQGTVFKNVAYGLKVRGVPRDQWSGRVAEALSMVDLDGFENRSARGLSGGETQRVAIARALVFHPQVILLDEPTAGVDVARVAMIETLIKDLNTATGVSILFSTHDLAQAHRLTDRVVHLAGGKRVERQAGDNTPSSGK
jgi:tungstate transport system ATP-binding protein